MTKILNKMAEVIGVLECLASMKGNTITAETSDLLLDTCETLDGVMDRLAGINAVKEE